jgi:hypothetical protein
MMNSFWKIMPLLTFGLGVSASAQEEIAAYKTVKPAKQQVQTAPCGLVEHDCTCFARSAPNALGGAWEMDFLWWRAENPAFTYAFDIKDPHSAIATGYLIGSLMQLEAKWDPGFRIGFGWNTDFDRWDVFTDWTWYSAHSEETSTTTGLAGTEMGYHSMWPVSVNNEEYQRVHASWHMWYNAIDLELGRAFYITKALSLRPHAGLRGGWINQKFKCGCDLPVGGTIYKADFHGKNDFWGVGPRIGIIGNWHIDNSQWSILCKTSGALLSGKTETRYISDYYSLGVYVPERDMQSHFTQIVPTVQFFLGLDWGMFMGCNAYYLGINAGWEANVYWNQFNLLSANGHAATGYDAPFPTMGNQAVMMDGMTFNMHFDF